MKTVQINLGYSSFYTKIRYSAGELQVRLTNLGMEAIKGSDIIDILAQIQSSEDLIEYLLLKDAIGNFLFESFEDGSIKKTEINTIFPYLPYGRADRRFVPGDCGGLEFFQNLIYSSEIPGNFYSLDIHNPKATTIVNVPADTFIRQAIEDFAKRYATNDSIVVLLPDAGAIGRYKIPESVGYNHKIIKVLEYNCQKKRDPISGKFLSFEVPSLPEGMPVLIVDDLCDAGGTFLGIRNFIPTDTKVGLYVTHGIFSKGLKPLTNVFERIYTTDSFTPNIGDESTESFNSWQQFECLSTIKKAIKNFS